MNENVKKTIILTFMFILLGVFISGGTYAYLSAITSDNTEITGKTRTLDVSVNVNSITSGSLVPTVDNLIITSLNGSYPCEDSRGYKLCSIYNVTLTNSGIPVNLNSYFEVNNSTTYTVNHLKYQMFTKSGNTYTAISDAGLFDVTGGNKTYLKSGANNVSFSLNDGTTSSYSSDYYLVVWLSDIGSNQLEDVQKTLNANIVFESDGGIPVKAQFSS